MDSTANTTVIKAKESHTISKAFQFDYPVNKTQPTITDMKEIIHQMQKERMELNHLITLHAKQSEIIETDIAELSFQIAFLNKSNAKDIAYISKQEKEIRRLTTINEAHHLKQDKPPVKKQ